MQRKTKEEISDKIFIVHYFGSSNDDSCSVVAKNFVAIVKSSIESYPKLFRSISEFLSCPTSLNVTFSLRLLMIQYLFE